MSYLSWSLFYIFIYFRIYIICVLHVHICICSVCTCISTCHIVCSGYLVNEGSPRVSVPQDLLGYILESILLG